MNAKELIEAAKRMKKRGVGGFTSLDDIDLATDYILSTVRPDNDEHAQVGALLARCCDYRLGEYEQGWFAEITLRNNETGNSGTFQPTQLAAIKTAVEAAEKGVRE